MLPNITPEHVEQARAMADAWLATKDRGQAGPNSAAMVAVTLVVGLVVASLVAAFLLPIGISEIVGVDTSSWSSGAQSMWDILDVIIVLALFLFFIALALAAANRV